MTNQERLGEIKRSAFKNRNYDITKLMHGDVVWLVAQVEQYRELAQQNKRYREALEKIKKEEAVTTALSEGQVAYTFSGHIARKALEESER